MKRSHVIIGILILIIGSILFIGGIMMVEVADEAISEYETLPGEIVRILSPEQEQHYQDAKEAKQTGQMLEVVGGVVGVVGVAVMIVGYQKVEEEPQQQQIVIVEQPTSQESKYCSSCGREISTDYECCPYCGAEKL